MSEFTIRSDFDVELVEFAGSDELICKAARVSTLGADSIDSEESAGLINFLMKGRHGSPFEHAMLMFRITAPIFVWREFMRHRVGVSYNEQSGRYMELSGEFYIPDNTIRPLVQQGKPGAYTFVLGAKEQRDSAYLELTTAYGWAWHAYQNQLLNGVAKEVARMCLPVATYSTAYVTMNPRSLMHFLSLRTKHEDSAFPSYPQWEINQVADQMEAIFVDKFSTTAEAFTRNGRVCP